MKRAARDNEEALRDSEALYRSLVDNLPQNIFRKDLKSRVTFANQRYCTLLGRSLEELIGLDDHDLFPPDLAKKYQKDDRWVMKTGKILEVEEEHVTPAGKKIYVQVVKTPLHNARGDLIGIQGIFWDVTERREMQENLKRMNEILLRASITDPLTGAYNRLYLSRELPVMVSAFGRADGTLSAVMFDVDDFKHVNDAHGHQAGDEALRICARRAKDMLRRKSDLLVRLGGDEFVVLLFHGPEGRDFPDMFAKKLLGGVRRTPIPVGKAGERVKVTLSIGIADLAPDEAHRMEGIETVLNRADRAMYAAKAKGKNCMVRYSKGLDR